MGNRSIAKELCLSVETISSYRTNILLKTKMKNNAKITYHAIQNKLAECSGPSGAPSCHRTNTDSKLGQTATRVSDRSRY